MVKTWTTLQRCTLCIYALLLVQIRCALPLMLTGFLFFFWLSSSNSCCSSSTSKTLQGLSIMCKLARALPARARYFLFPVSYNGGSTNKGKTASRQRQFKYKYRSKEKENSLFWRSETGNLLMSQSTVWFPHELTKHACNYSLLPKVPPEAIYLKFLRLPLWGTLHCNLAVTLEYASSCIMHLPMCMTVNAGQMWHRQTLKTESNKIFITPDWAQPALQTKQKPNSGIKRIKVN